MEITQKLDLTLALRKWTINEAQHNLRGIMKNHFVTVVSNEE